MSSTDKVRVAVRVRPFNKRELEMVARSIVEMDDKNQTLLHHPSFVLKDSETSQQIKQDPKVFAFDHCFWSVDEKDAKFTTQEMVFNCLGRDILEKAFAGYNACIIAYGQTGSGKSYTMMGTAEQRGVIPRLCNSLFERIASNTDPDVNFNVQVSYMEIYNEKVRDLLDPKGKHDLRVREHNILGPYVDDLSTLAVSSFEDIENLMSEGNKARTVASTNMNSESSRSHAVFNIILTLNLIDRQSGVTGERVAKMSLVDLAGSERAQKTGAVGDRLKEGSNINKSLTTLGLVISALADQASGKATKNKFVPYRDSVLTWLLKDNLGGNSKTVMVATVSPAADNYEETLSTLRYADRAKRIVNHAVINEDPNAKIIRELREEVESLRRMLSEAQSMSKPGELQERLVESEKLMKEMSKTWEEKLIETEKIHQERHAALEKMGISVQGSGIKVEKGKYYLVNLNADPSLNELLVYYLKEHTLVGRSDASPQQDIQLSGIGIKPQHAIVDIDDSEVYITPLEDAKTCINGRAVTSRTKVKHGDRILWGNNHFFRINCPKANSPTTEMPETIDYVFAQQELLEHEMGPDPVHDAIMALERQHEEDKQEALQRQRTMYERQMQTLRNQLMSPSTPSAAAMQYLHVFSDSISAKLNPATSVQAKYHLWMEDREKVFKQSLLKLKEDVMKANVLVREANFLSREMNKQTNFSVTLQIPASNLSPNRKRGTFVSEPAIVVKRTGLPSQVWTVDKFENKIVDMRDMYEDRKDCRLPMQVTDLTSTTLNLTPGNDPDVDDCSRLLDVVVDADNAGPPVKGDPFYEMQENHNLIGVANIFLQALFYHVKLDYLVPIISQQGEVVGRLHIELSRENELDDYEYNSRGGDEGQTALTVSTTIVCRVGIREARGLPATLSHFVFCQYVCWGQSEPVIVLPVMGDTEDSDEQRSDGTIVRFNHQKDFTVHVTEEFVEHCMDGALSIELLGQRAAGFGGGANVLSWQLDDVQAKSRTIRDRWLELTRKIEMWVEVHELSDQGEYVPVEVTQSKDVLTGGVFQLRQGHSRRMVVRLVPVQNSGTLPLIVESIQSVMAGGVVARSKLQRGLDSYQEEDLNTLRQRWSKALDKRKDYLDIQLQKIVNKTDKSDTDREREQSLIDQWVTLTEERNAVVVPAAGSAIPGAPADWIPPPGMEEHIPVIFLDLNAEDLSTSGVKEGLQAAGISSILPKEHLAQFFTLPFVKNSDKELCAVLSWDSSIHDSIHLNGLTPNNERIYLIVKAVVRLSHPASMELMLRKRICINVYKRQSITEKLRSKISKSDAIHECGVTYELVSNIPRASEDLENPESLAQIAASQNDIGAPDGETYIEKYIRGVSAVESILTLDRLRQEVAIKELMAARSRSLRKSTSVPNIAGLRSEVLDMDYERFGGMPKPLSVDNFRQRQTLSPADLQSVALNKPSSAGYALTPTKSPSGRFTMPMKTVFEEQFGRDSRPSINLPDVCASSESSLDTRASSPSAGGGNGSSNSSNVRPSAERPQSTLHDAIASYRTSLEAALKTDHAEEDVAVDPPQAQGGERLRSPDVIPEEDSHLVGSGRADSGAESASRPVVGTAVSTSDSVAPTSNGNIIDNQQAQQPEVNSNLTNNNDISSKDIVNAEPVDQPFSAVQPASDAVQQPDNYSSNNVSLTTCNNNHEGHSNGNGSEGSNDGEMTPTADSSSSHNASFSAKSTSSPPQTTVVNHHDTNHTNGDGEEPQVEVEGSAKQPAITMTTSSSSNSNNNNNVSETPTSAATVVKLRKGGAVEVTKAQVKKVKGTSGGGKGSSATTPLKATYRPVSMPLQPREGGYHSEDTDDEDVASQSSFGSRADLGGEEGPLPAWLQVQLPVLVLHAQGDNSTGVVQYVGPTDFASGTWVGVELDNPEGKNDGSVNGVRYFKCRARHGIFVRHDRLIPDKRWKGSRGAIGPQAPSPSSTTPQQQAKSPSSAVLNRSMGNLALTSPVASPGSATSVSKSASFMRPTAASAARHPSTTNLATATSTTVTSSSSTGPSPKQK